MKIEYPKALNPAQWEAVRTTEGPVLVIAGAGSGKTRTIVYRLAYLVEQGVAPQSILLLTFTRRAAEEMLNRAGGLLDQGVHDTSGGTFHGFAFSVLRRYSGSLGFPQGFTVMDRADAEGLIRQIRDDMKLGKGDRSFPKKSTVLDMISKSRNKELDMEELLQSEALHLMRYGEDIERMADSYAGMKQRLGLMDYDDLLFLLEKLLLNQPDLAEFYRTLYRYIMVDEYQDTNLVQGRLVRLLSGETGNLMVVGDDAQSIYAFRGANVRNILSFPQSFPSARIIKLEENYRSTQEILHLTNRILAGATEKYEKNLFSQRTGAAKPQLVRTISDTTQAQLAANRILELADTYPLHDIAVLFRAGYQSFSLEVILNRLGLEYQKFGGMRFTESAHIKDVLSFMRLVVNPVDLPAWQRALAHVKGVGPKTCLKLLEATLDGNQKGVRSLCSRFDEVGNVLSLLDGLRGSGAPPTVVLEKILEYYIPFMKELYPDDYPKRMLGLEQLSQIVSGYDSIENFLADLSLESPDASGRRAAREDALVLSTVHSAKGLEWSAVIIIDLVEERFPSRHAMLSSEEFEEERRLLYVACTRARDSLTMFVPETVYNRYNGRGEPALPSPFISELPRDCYDELRENYSGGLSRRSEHVERQPAPPSVPSAPPRLQGGPAPASPPPANGFCRHKIFGRGKIIGFLPPDKYRVNFPGFGMKVIIRDYLQMEGGS
ncbi:MAG: ATP-dependent helicase [Desulfovibrionales bacterium]